MTLAAPHHDYADYDELLEDYYERGWTDGLPVVPPTPAKVERFLAVAGLASRRVGRPMPQRRSRAASWPGATAKIALSPGTPA